MAVYILYLVLAGLQYWYADKKGYLATKRGRKYYLILCCEEMILLAILRGYTVGADTKRYLDALEYYSKLPKSKVLFAGLKSPFDFEPGYFLFTKICALINMPKTVFLLVVALVIYIPVFYTIYRYSRLPYISILAYFGLGIFAYSLGIFRQMMALSIILCGMKYLERRQLVQYLLLVLLAMTIHATALVMIALFFLVRIPVEKYMKWILPVELVCLLLGRPIVALAAKLLPQYAHYMGGRYDVQGGTYLMLILLNVLLFALIYLNRKGFTKSRLVMAALSLGVLVQSIGYSMGLFGRLTVYFSYFAIFAFSEIAYIMMNRPKIYGIVRKDVLGAWERGIAFTQKHEISVKTIVWTVFIAGLAVLILIDLIGNHYILPYTFFFSK